ncbi:MAG: DUF5947 family protein [Kofleriaceae bacterium]
MSAVLAAFDALIAAAYARRPAVAEAEAVVAELAAAGPEDAAAIADRIAALGDALAPELVEDPLFAALLVLTGKHPVPAIERARRALAAATHELASVGVVFDRIDDAIVVTAEATPDRARVATMIEMITTTSAPDLDELPIVIAGVSAPDFVPLTRLRRTDHARCELCALPLDDRHDHLLAADLRVTCACRGCALVGPQGYRAIPRGIRTVAIPDVAGWLDRLNIPVGIAAMIRRDDGRIVIGYPGPAGLVESTLDPALVATLDVELAPEIEALVWSHLGVLRCGIDAVFRLIGEIRRSWQGITGGEAGHAAVARVLADLQAEAA